MRPGVVSRLTAARLPAPRVRGAGLLTGWGEGVSAHESMQYVDRVIAKPVSAEALLEQLAGLTRSRVPPA